MRKTFLLLLATSISTSAYAQSQTDTPPPQTAVDNDVVTTGVARGRDRLSSATSTSVLKQGDIDRIGPTSIGEIFRYIPGVRSETGWGDGAADITVRGLPMASTGAKFLSIQEDGLPVVEYGDITFASPTQFVRADLNLAQVESIRGGSASTFASNAPGGVINLISKTGETAGGTLKLGSGINYNDKRIDFEYGSPINDSLRFHVGGFYRVGTGPRTIGYNANKGGQFKFNLTKTFDAGYLRISGKYLDDRTPAYLPTMISVTGTDANPVYSPIANYDLRSSAFNSPYLRQVLTTDANNRPYSADMTQGQHAVVKSLGFEAQIELAGWTISDKMRYSDMSSEFTGFTTPVVSSVNAFITQYAGAGGSAAYAVGPNAGQAITAASNINGNNLLSLTTAFSTRYPKIEYAVNDLRASRVWKLGKADFTGTLGFYTSLQSLNFASGYSSIVTDLNGNGSTPVNLFNAAGTAVTQNGYLAYGSLISSFTSRVGTVDYRTNAAFGSVNYQLGKFSIGASLRYDFGNAAGTIAGAELGGGRARLTTLDMNGDGVISLAETKVNYTPLTTPAPVNYSYRYLSYSSGVVYRLAEPVALFARYSRGARANSDRLLYTTALNSSDGSLAQPDAVIDYVNQAEGGVKYRRKNVVVNVTAFYATTREHNSFLGPIIDRKYRAYGAEFEGAVRLGAFSLNAGATYTKATLVSDLTDPTLNGNVPKRQPNLFYSLIPQFEKGPVKLGAAVYGVTSSYAQDQDQLKLPAYVTVSPFVMVTVVPGIKLSANVNNVFNVIGVPFMTVVGPVRHAGANVPVQVINGRTAAAALTVQF